MGMISGAGAGFFAGVGNMAAASAVWDFVAFGFDASMNAANVIGALNNSCEKKII